MGGRFNEQQDHARFCETLQRAGFVFPALEELKSGLAALIPWVGASIFEKPPPAIAIARQAGF